MFTRRNFLAHSFAGMALAAALLLEWALARD